MADGRRCAASCAALIVLAASASCAQPPRPSSLRVVATPLPTATPEPTPAPTVVPAPVARPKAPVSVAAPKPRVTARPKPRPAAPAPRPVSIDAFRGLGAWIDVYDFNDDPQSILPAVRDIAARGVRTLYLETARFNSPSPFLFPRANAAALEESHRLGMKVVAWYPPDFVDLNRDVAYTLAAVNYVSPAGHRFDAVAPDIERLDIKDHNERTARLLDYSRRVRAGSPAGYPLAAITIPTSSPYYRAQWPSFPWAEIGRIYDVAMPMAYWTGRKADAPTAASLTAENLRDTARMTGLPVHVIGGVADQIDLAQATAYVDAALAGGSIGGSLYDYRTSREEIWAPLARVNR
ncbi:MAG TPA: hypothetical protein VNE62_05540 [Actinomycetota bacterium]|nr:hypothetical protein [Actinomycetota bacterium]